MISPKLLSMLALFVTSFRRHLLQNTDDFCQIVCGDVHVRRKREEPAIDGFCLGTMKISKSHETADSTIVANDARVEGACSDPRRLQDAKLLRFHFLAYCPLVWLATRNGFRWATPSWLTLSSTEKKAALMTTASCSELGKWRTGK